MQFKLFSQANRALILFVSFLSFPTLGFPAIETPLPSQLRPIDNFQQNLQKIPRSKEVKILKQAYDSLQNEDYSQAIKLASRVQKGDAYSDYGYWIASAAYRAQALDQLDKNRYSLALNSALKAVSLSLQIEGKCPYSPFLKYASREIAQAEMIMGDGHWGNHKWAAAQHHFESALQRLQTQNLLAQADASHLQHFAEACKKSPTPLCRGWILRLATTVPKQAQTGIIHFFPSVINDAKSPRYSGKTSIPYKAPDLDQAAFEGAMNAYLNEKYSAATQGFQELLDTYPRSSYRIKARYWLAQSLIHQKENGKAQKIYSILQADNPLSYYGILASNATDKPLDSMIDAQLPLATESDPFLLPQEMIHLKRAEQLIAEKAYSLAVFELKDIKARDALSSPFLVYLAMLNYKCGNYGMGFNLIGELLQRGYEGIFSTYGLHLTFPLNFLELINKYALENSLDPILVLSLIKQESAFAEDANSSAGAMGLMQLMPATAMDTDPTMRTPDLLEAEINIRIGTKYLKKLLTRYNGNIVFALASYNAGPTAVDRWRKDTPPGRGMPEFIETIPYKETREYVSSIIRNYFWYSRELNGRFSKDLNYFWNVYGPPESPPRLPGNSPVKQQNGNA